MCPQTLLYTPALAGDHMRYMRGGVESVVVFMQILCKLYVVVLQLTVEGGHNVSEKL